MAKTATYQEAERKLFRDDKNPGNPQNTPSLSAYLRDGLPKAMIPFRYLLERAVDKTLPTRKQRWERTGRPQFGDPEKASDRVNDQDPNTLIYYAANTLLFIYEKPSGERTEANIKNAHECLAILAYWQEQLTDFFEAERSMEAALTVYQSSAPIRYVE